VGKPAPAVTGNRLRTTCAQAGTDGGRDTPAHRAAQALFRPPAITSPSTTPEPAVLPRVAAAREIDRLARWRLGLPQQDYHRWTFAEAVTADAFGDAKRRGRRGCKR
jgi:hypothetical protein